MKVLWFDHEKEEFVPYRANENIVSKFLCWRNLGLILTASFEGDISSHRDLYLLGHSAGLNIDPNPDGAGNVERGVIVDWQSFGFKLKTPSELQIEIIEALELTTTA